MPPKRKTPSKPQTDDENEQDEPNTLTARRIHNLEQQIAKLNQVNSKLTEENKELKKENKELKKDNEKLRLSSQLPKPKSTPKPKPTKSTPTKTTRVIESIEDEDEDIDWFDTDDPFNQFDEDGAWINPLYGAKDKSGKFITVCICTEYNDTEYLTLDVDLTIGEVKEIYHEVGGAAPKKVRFEINGKHLFDKYTLKHYGIQHGMMIEVHKPK